MLLGYGAKVCLRKMRVKAENRMVTDLSTRPEEHLWYSIQDSTEYKKREEMLIKELEQPNFSNHASNYMN